MSLLALSPDLLVDIATGLATAQDMWRPMAEHPGPERHSARLLATDEYEAWLLGWLPGHRVDLHDHGNSAAAVVVVAGELVELRPLRSRSVRTLTVAEPVTVPVGEVHDILNLGVGPATSIHVYSPPLTEMTFYDDSGTRRLHTVPVE